MVTRTTTQLMEELLDPTNAEAWGRFDARYRPVLVGFALRLGLSAEDATELAQRTMAEFFEVYRSGRYDRGKGRLSSWLIGIARNTASTMRRPRGAGRRIGGDTVAGEMPAPLPDGPHLTRIWEREREQAILNDAMAVLRTSTKTEPNTLRAFELFAVRGMSAEAVAAECGLSVDAVYVVKNRLTKRLREIVRDLTSAYDEGE